MNNLLTILIVEMTIPFVVYLSVKLGTFAFYRARTKATELGAGINKNMNSTN